MAQSRKGNAQHSDNTGVNPNLSGIDASKENAPDQPSGARPADDLIAQAEEIVANAAEPTAEAKAAEAGDAEVVEATVVEDAAPAAQDGKAADKADSKTADDAKAAEAAAKAAADLAAAKAEAADWQGRYLRLHAEWDTYRRRTNEQRAEEKARATEKLVGELLPVLDDFERTIEYATNNGETGLLSGVQAVQTKLVNTLTKAGVEVIDPAGQAFDALEAQAVATVEDASVPDETVAQVYQKGYKMGGHVLRPAMVTVSTGGPKREPAGEKEN